MGEASRACLARASSTTSNGSTGTYDALVFFSLEHATTVEGLRIAADRSVLFPYLQPRPSLRFALWREIIESVSGIGFLSAAERVWARRTWAPTLRPRRWSAIGIDPPPQLAYPRHQQDPADTLTPDDEVTADAPEPAEIGYLSSRGITFRRRHRLYGSFALYGGRVEPDNGCVEMLEYFSGQQSDPDQTAAPADGRQADEGAGPAGRHARRRPARSRADGGLRSRGRDDRAQLRRPARAGRAREPRRRHARAGQRRQRRRGRSTAVRRTAACTTPTATSSSRP